MRIQVTQYILNRWLLNERMLYIFHFAATRNVIIASIVLNCLYFAFCLLLFVGGVKVNLCLLLYYEWEEMHYWFPNLQECSRYLIPWIIAELIRHLLFLAAFFFLAWCFSVLVNKREIDCKSRSNSFQCRTAHIFI